MFQPQAHHVATHILPSGHVLVRPDINGEDVGWMVLDSGASGMVIEPDVANTLNLPTFARFQVRTLGGRVASHYRVAHFFQLGPLIMEECGPHLLCRSAAWHLLLLAKWHLKCLDMAEHWDAFHAACWDELAKCVDRV